MQIYYSTITSFYHIWSRERAKYETVIHCSVTEQIRKEREFFNERSCFQHHARPENLACHPLCFVEIVTTSQSINELNYFPNCDTLQARQPFGNYSVLLYLCFTVIIFLIRLLCVTYRFRATLTKNKQQFETHGFGCVSQQNIRNQMNHHG